MEASRLPARQRWFLDRLAQFQAAAARVREMADVRALFEAAAEEWNQGWDRRATARAARLATPMGPCAALVVESSRKAATGTLVWLHGGGFILGSSRAVIGTMAVLAEAGGVTVVGLDYPLAPECPYPAALNLVSAVLTLVAQDPAAAGVARAPLLVGGESAGAHLALMAAVSVHRKLSLRGLLLACPAIYPELPGRPDADAGIARVWNAYLPERGMRIDPRANPALADLQGLPPTYVLAASEDAFLADAIEVARQLVERQVEVTLRVHAPATHGFIALCDSCPIAMAGLKEAAGFLDMLVRKETTACEPI